MAETSNSPTSANTDEGLYVYAIVAADTQPQQIAGSGGPLFIVRSGALGAVVATISESPQEERVAAPETSPGTSPGTTAAAPPTRSLLRHEAIVEAICDEIPALPVRFGTTMPNAEALARALERHAETLLADLRRLGGKVEMGVIALWNPAEQTGAPTGGEPSQPGEPDEPDESRPGVSYLRQRQAQYRREEATRARAQRLGHDLDDELGPHALLTRRSVCPSERMALRDAYLLERANIQAFERAFEAARRQHREARLLLSGPWPPYSFVTRPAERPADEAEDEADNTAAPAAEPGAASERREEDNR